MQAPQDYHTLLHSETKPRSTNQNHSSSKSSHKQTDTYTADPPTITSAELEPAVNILPEPIKQHQPVRITSPPNLATGELAHTAPPLSTTDPPIVISEDPSSAVIIPPHHAAPSADTSPSQVGQVVVYLRPGEHATVLKVHRDDPCEVYITIRMPDGREKQTTVGHLQRVLLLPTQVPHNAGSSNSGVEVNPHARLKSPSKSYTANWDSKGSRW